MGALGGRGAVGGAKTWATALVVAWTSLCFAACFTDEPPELTTTPATGASSSTTSNESATDPSAGSRTAGSTTGTTAGTTDGTTGETTEETTTLGPTTGIDPVYACPDVPELVLCYEFETGWEDGTLLDTSAALYHGFMSEETQVPGHTGSAALLDGSSAVFVSYDEQIFQRLLGEFTVAAWIQPNTEGLSGTRGIIERDGNVRLALVGNGTTYELSCDSPEPGTVVSSLALEPGTWVHAACVYDGLSLSLWVNGVLIGEEAGMISVLGDDSMRIGNDGPSAGPDTALLGLIDEVQIWELALTGQALCGAAGIPGCI